MLKDITIGQYIPGDSQMCIRDRLQRGGETTWDIESSVVTQDNVVLS